MPDDVPLRPDELDYRSLSASAWLMHTPNGGPTYRASVQHMDDFLAKRPQTLTNKKIALSAGTTTKAPLIFMSGGLLSTPSAGSLEFDGTNLYFTPASLRKTIAFSDTALPSQGGHSGKYLTTNGTIASWAAILIDSLLPTQGGQSGKYLTTNGTSSSWGSITVDGLLPAQGGQSGKYLTTNGTASSWGAITIDGLLPAQGGQSGKYLTTNGTVSSWATVDALPSQPTHSGKYLTTDGTVASWASITADGLLPSQGGNSGKYLTTNGTNSSWGSITIDGLLPSQGGNSGKYLTTNGTTSSWATIDALPSQATHSGKYLTTNGTVASWSSITGLPSQTGHSGKFLTTDGSNPSWSNSITASSITATSDATNGSFYVPFLSGASGTVFVRTDAGLTYNPSTNVLSLNRIDFASATYFDYGYVSATEQNHIRCSPALGLINGSYSAGLYLTFGPILTARLTSGSAASGFLIQGLRADSGDGGNLRLQGGPKGASGVNDGLVQVEAIIGSTSSLFKIYNANLGSPDLLTVSNTGVITGAASWQAGIVGLAYGGTGANLTAANGAIAYSTSSALALSSVGTLGYFLTSGGAGAPTWTNPASITAGSATNASNVNVSTDTANTTRYVGWFANTGNQGTLINSNFNYNPTTGLVQVPSAKFTQIKTTTGTPIPAIEIVGGDHTITTNAEFHQAYFRYAGNQLWDAGGVPSLARCIRISAPNWASVATLTMADAATVSIDSAPVAQSSLTITRSTALRLAPGANVNHALIVLPHSSSQTGDLVKVRNDLNNGDWFTLDKRGRPVAGGTTPTKTAGDGAGGVGATITITGTDWAGRLEVTPTGTPTANATVVTITFSSSYASTPKSVMLTPGNAKAAELSGTSQVYVDTAALADSSWAIKSGSTALAAQTYVWHYQVIG